MSVILALVMMLTVMPMNVFTAESTSGTCGENLTWTFNTETGVLTIEGTGKMTNYDASNPAPWDEYKDQIKKIVVSDGVTTIGKGAFMGCASLSNAEYMGTDEQWEAVTIGENNDTLLEAMKDIVLGDGKVSSMDALQILNYSVGKIDKF